MHQGNLLDLDCFYLNLTHPPSCCRPLHVAAKKGLTVVVQELLGKGASVLAVDENGQISLYCTSLPTHTYCLSET